jgi:acyl carrier protein
MLYNKDIWSWKQTYGEGSEIVNLYGPTETTMVKTFLRIKEPLGDSNDKVNVGYPISSTAILIINESGALCGINETGEIYIKTPFITKGYFKDAALTDACFIQNPLNEIPGDIVYRTGDFGKYLEDRKIFVSGRKDDVVKYNGVRINLNDIDKVILKNKEVEQVKCIAHEGKTGIQLFCYYVSKSNLSIAGLREFCSSEMASYEMPGYFIKLDSMPLSPNGKVDKNSLPLPDEIKTMAYKAPTNSREEKLVEIWKELLGLDKIGTTDNFFDLGGHSIKLLQLISRISKEFNVRITPEVLFDYPWIEAISGEIEKVLMVNSSQLAENNKAADTERFTI